MRSSVPNLVKQIQKRGREYENSISIDYLNRLNQHYEQWIKDYNKGKLLIIEVDDIDFVNNPDDFSSIVTKIDGLLYGLF